jgi:hypothetical protein
MVDSRCTDHLSPYLDDLFQKKIGNGIVRQLMENLCLYIYGPGTVILKHHNGEKDTTLVLTGVYHAPYVSNCLLSVTALTKQGFTCTIRDKTQIWNKTGNLVITAEQLNSSGSLHWFTLSPMKHDARATSIQKINSYSLWHGHVEHCSRNVFRHGSSHVSGLPKLDIPIHLCPCQGCVLGKATQRPFPPSTSRGDKALALVHTDLCEFPIQSRTGFTWMMTFLDDFSGYSSIICLKRKSDVAITFHNWFALAEKVSGNKL